MLLGLLSGFQDDPVEKLNDQRCQTEHGKRVIRN